MKINVPYYSQHLDVVDPEWKGRACTITCLKMALDYFSALEDVSLDDLVEEGIDIGGFGPHGWIHDKIVILAHNHGAHAYKQEFRTNNKGIEEKFLNDGIEKTKNSLENENPVIISATRKFEDKGSFHTVLLIGFESKNENIEGFYYHDPDAKNIEDGKEKFVDLDTFKKHWRRLAIFLYKTHKERTK